MPKTTKRKLFFFFILFLFLSTLRAEAALNRKVIVNLVPYDQTRGYQSIQSNIVSISQVTARWYTTHLDGSVKPYLNSNGSPYVNQNIISYLHANNVLVTAGIDNVSNNVWNNNGLTSQILASSTLAQKHIDSIVNIVTIGNYDGAVIDYENLSASDRTNFSSFINSLSSRLHNIGKILAVDVYPKTSEPGNWNGPQSQDWNLLKNYADELRIMLYGYSWQTSVPGPISPESWSDSVLGYATSVIPLNKIVHGIPTYGIDWPSGEAGIENMWDVLYNRSLANNAIINWDSVSQSPWYTYSASEKSHTVWFENASSTDAKLALTNKHNILGVSVWRVGGEDPKTWNVINARFGVTTPPPSDTTPPTISITQPTANAFVSNNQKISASASDNVKVNRVMFYVDNTLLATDTLSPYTTNWLTTKITSGQHTIKTVAYDDAGNSAESIIAVRKR